MKITDAFLGEHAVFYAQFTYLEGALPHVEDVPIIKTYGTLFGTALTSHAHLEEELLFKTLEPHMGSKRPLAVLRKEHEDIEQSLERLSNVKESVQARELLLKVITDARNHFAKEECFFRIVIRILSGDFLSDLGTQWAARCDITLE